MREDGGLDQGGSDGGSDSRFVLKVKAIGFADELQVECEKKKGVRKRPGIWAWALEVWNCQQLRQGRL